MSHVKIGSNNMSHVKIGSNNMSHVKIGSNNMYTVNLCRLKVTQSSYASLVLKTVLRKKSSLTNCR